MVDYGNGGSYEVTMDGPFSGGGGSSSKMTTIYAAANDWKGGTSPYFQIVTIENISVNSKVDLQMSAAQIEALSNQSVAFTCSNNGGIATLYAIGDKPSITCEFQVTLSDVVNIGNGESGIIQGNMVGTIMPRADYSQNDPNKADFIKNKPTEDLADAKKKANAALPRTGGMMTGNVDMGGNTLTGLAEPVNDGDAVNKKHLEEKMESAKNDMTNYVDTRLKYFEVSLSADAWEGESAPYKQTISVEGMLAKYRPHYGPVYSEGDETAIAEKEAWTLVDKMDTSDGSVTFTCFEDKPQISVNVQMEVHQ